MNRGMQLPGREFLPRGHSAGERVVVAIGTGLAVVVDDPSHCDPGPPCDSAVAECSSGEVARRSLNSAPAPFAIGRAGCVRTSVGPFAEWREGLGETMAKKGGHLGGKLYGKTPSSFRRFFWYRRASPQPVVPDAPRLGEQHGSRL